MGDELLVGELQQVLAACKKAGIPVFVIGAFSVRAYDCLLRVSQDLDLAVTSDYWPKLKRLLGSLGYSITPEQIWMTATKPIGDSQIEINIALNGVTDLDSAITYPLAHHRPEPHRPVDLDFDLPVLPLEAVLITKLIALREKDLADLLSIFLQRGSDIQPERFWRFAHAAGITRRLRERLHEVVDQVRGGEAVSVWYDRMGAILTDPERDSTLAIIQHLLKGKRYG